MSEDENNKTDETGGGLVHHGGDKKKELAANVNFMDLTDVAINLSYSIPGFGKIEISFPALRILMDNEEQTARQKFFSQPPEKQIIGRHAYNVELLSKLCQQTPVGLPGFEDMLINTGAAGEADRLEKAIYKYFIQPKPMNVKVANDALDKYARVTADEDFFR